MVRRPGTGPENHVLSYIGKRGNFVTVGEVQDDLYNKRELSDLYDVAQRTNKFTVAGGFVFRPERCLDGNQVREDIMNRIHGNQEVIDAILNSANSNNQEHHNHTQSQRMESVSNKRARHGSIRPPGSGHENDVLNSNTQEHRNRNDYNPKALLSFPKYPIISIVCKGSGDSLLIDMAIKTSPGASLTHHTIIDKFDKRLADAWSSNGLVLMHDVEQAYSQLVFFWTPNKIDTQTLMSRLLKGRRTTLNEFVNEYGFTKRSNPTATDLLNAFGKWYSSDVEANSSIVETVRKATTAEQISLEEGNIGHYSFMRVGPKIGHGARIVLWRRGLVDAMATGTSVDNNPHPFPIGNNIPSLQTTMDFHVLMSLFKPEVQSQLVLDLERLRDIIMDLGCPYYKETESAKTALQNDDGTPLVVSAGDLKNIAERVSCFGDDNRACLQGTLHRISAIRNKDHEIMGLTMRIGRQIIGCADLLLDILFDYNSSTGKTYYYWDFQEQERPQ